jgi:hypothetical protein
VFGGKDDKGVHCGGALATFADHQWVHVDLGDPVVRVGRRPAAGA